MCKTDFCVLVLVRCYRDLALCISHLVFTLPVATEMLRCEFMFGFHIALFFKKGIQNNKRFFRETLSTSMWCFAHASGR